MDEVLIRRYRELAARSVNRGAAVFTHFMDLAQIQLAMAAASGEGARLALEGGYPEAERRMGAFYADVPPEPWEWPIQAVRMNWRARFGSPGHRDFLGALMALGFERERMGDIVLLEDSAYVFAEPDTAEFIVRSLQAAGSVSVKCSLSDELPDFPPPAGRMVRDTVPSLRLDALLAAGFAVSRSEASEWISRGRAFVNQAQSLRPDVVLREGDLISLRGEGRLRVEKVEGETRKGRLAVRLFRYGS